MQLENIATPQEDTTPQLRYASLHRAVERGLASDDVLRELVEICLQLGHVDEAIRVHANMKPGPTRELVGSRLARRGLIAAEAQAADLKDEFGGDDDRDPSVVEHCLDAVQFLTQAHMPAVALLTMLAFPLVVGLGGFLTAGGSLWLFAGLATLPGLCVLGVVGAMGRQIFLQSAEGDEEIPAIPPPSEMVHMAGRHFGDVLLVLGALVAPSLTLLWFELPLVSSLPGLTIGMFLTPIALILRQVRGDLGALSPVALLRGIGCCKGYSRVTGAFWLAFAPAAIAFWTTLGHAVWLQIAIIGPLAVLPTFATARLLGTFTEVHRSRLGLLLHPMTGGSGTGNTTKPAVSAAKKPQPARKAGSPAAGATKRKPVARRLSTGFGSKATPRVRPLPMSPLAQQLSEPRPQTTDPARVLQKALGNLAPKLPAKPGAIAGKALQSTPQPVSTPQPAAPQQSPAMRRPQPEDWAQQTTKKSAPAARRIEGRAPTKQSSPGRAPAPAKPAAPSQPQPAARPAAPAPRPRPAAPAPTPAKKAPSSVANMGPDLSNMPGATIITGEDRERFGASSTSNG